MVVPILCSLQQGSSRCNGKIQGRMKDPGSYYVGVPDSTVLARESESVLGFIHTDKETSRTQTAVVEVLRAMSTIVRVVQV